MSKTEFWEANFQDKQEMWGMAPAQSAVLASDLFAAESIHNVLIPGFGYGRNAQVFRDKGMDVTGIEISQTAIDLARKHAGPAMTIHYGSVTDMPFDDAIYDGVFCYALIHLLGSGERAKLVSDCYRQLSPGGLMVFTAISKEAHTYGQGKLLDKDRYEIHAGVSMFFYDEASIRAEFGQAGLLEIREIHENFPFFFIICRKDIA
ncbi:MULTISPECIES: bifunctional 2-polyprenyl-6-hydroxyphenol methylase/3-demethylubiquinol 3-O-methyltransferase UbiG [unclassified Janthinobacterium]|uniref:class I SAM-dependent methyltransferase n=1 Tax=unclassified Janthinobacterium TaxID=2610881 RepID=UPI00160E8D59|nr:MULTISPECIES: class I SAM-dependent methyltransferase [unclassified Janthinobacterium]MBB5371274.1 SAM-dependent methyltransferase [Janthinobacterium sp. K2C7]MBB5384080.1 SAM-dependent methyltransferase [Janthinobacterium sp. K2Li3]MBB5389460.1 SAM-dependent methyltransferase [Janthinobacterium sp. K2E3]